MIAVIADDLTGAAELGGVGLRHNLQVQVSLAVPAESRSQLLVIATDTRSRPVQLAVEEMALHTSRLLPHGPVLLYKKIDSVLRGHVLAEVQAQLEVLGLRRALIVPANPHLGRTIRNSQYYFQGQPIHTTSFSHDPEFAITDSSIHAMLRSGNIPVHVLKTHEPLPQEGIVVGEVEEEADLATWAEKAGPDTMLVGASGFFNALLKRLTGSAGPDPALPVKLHTPLLYVSGSTFERSRAAIRREAERGGPVSYVPASIIAGEVTLDPLFERWTNDIVALLQTRSRCIVAVDPASTGQAGITAAQLRMITARVTGQVLERTALCELLVEGGATAWAVLEQAELGPLQPVQELAPGVVRMRVESKECLYLTIKPGSYHWPDSVLDSIYHD
jgi:uncharacterized protein YgbK (DUF1537 family)